MLLIKTKVGVSSIEGLGVIAQTSVPLGATVWRYQKNFDITLSDEEFDTLPDIAKQFFMRYAYYSKVDGGYVLCGDNARYTNHSSTPNTRMINRTETVAIMTINAGDEITEDYATFDELYSDKLKCI